MEKGIVKPCWSYNMIIDGLCKDKMVDQALELFDKMIEKGITYNSLIHGLRNFGREGEAAKLLIDMEEKEIYPDTRVNLNIDLYGRCVMGFVGDRIILRKIMMVVGILIEEDGGGEDDNKQVQSSLITGFDLQGLFVKEHKSEASSTRLHLKKCGGHLQHARFIYRLEKYASSRGMQFVFIISSNSLAKKKWRVDPGAPASGPLQPDSSVGCTILGPERRQTTERKSSGLARPNYASTSWRHP
ncbi:putative tetratricopeptide-like helical domain superfamily protein [Tanacetum coccineum]